MARRLVRLALIALVLAAADQALKAWMTHLLAAGPIQVIPGCARLILVYNTGAIFGSLAGLKGSAWLLSGATLLALGLAVWVAASRLGAAQGMLWSLGLICGGGLGNLVDRVRLGRVLDFVDLYWGTWHWPAFNLADAGITIGGLYVAFLLLRGKA